MRFTFRLPARFALLDVGDLLTLSNGSDCDNIFHTITPSDCGLEAFPFEGVAHICKIVEHENNYREVTVAEWPK
jgi:hypothetical protein